MPSMIAKTAGGSVVGRAGPRDECGVFGVYAPGHDVARLAYFGLYALQHRGQESAGIATCEGGHITTMRELGLVSQVFDEEKLQALEGAYSTVVMTKHAVVAFRDPHGVRPLALGKMKASDGFGECFVVASESCAFDIIGAQLIREVQPGEMVSLTAKGLELKPVITGEQPAQCVFEHIYFSRPDSRLENRVLQEVRGRMGELLAEEAPVEADLVISVPDSGNPMANGFARATGLPKDDGLIKNRYVGRTFIQPGHELRKHGLRMKFNPLPEI